MTARCCRAGPGWPDCADKLLPVRVRWALLCEQTCDIDMSLSLAVLPVVTCLWTSAIDVVR